MAGGAIERRTRTSAVTEAEVIRAGRRRFLRGERIDMRSVAAEIGIGRATIFRWFGDRDRFVSEVLWSLASDTLEGELAKRRARGPSHVIDAIVCTLEAITDHEQFQRFLARDAQRAMVVLTGRDSAVSNGLRRRLAELIADECPRAVTAELPPDELAYSMVRLAEAYCYANILAGRPVEVQRTRALFHRLLEGK